MKIGFDRFIQISTIIIVPISLALAGHLFGVQMKNAELESQDKRFTTEHQFELAKQDATWRITKSELVYKFMDALTSSEEIKRKLAVEAIMIALPEDGPRIAEVVAKNDPNVEVQNAANNSIRRQILRISNEMFSQDKSTRLSGTQTAISGWQNNEEFIRTIIDKSIKEVQNSDGVWNAIIYLENTNKDYLKSKLEDINALKLALESYGDRGKTIDRLNKNIIEKIL